MKNSAEEILIILAIAMQFCPKFSSAALPTVTGDFNISIIHINDFHSRFEEVNSDSRTCAVEKENCIGGIARVSTAVKQLLEKQPDSLFLNAGDNFQGTLWYIFFKWSVTQYILNKLPTDVYTLGNHEFIDGIAGLVPFINHLNAPVVVSNVDVSEEPDMQGLFNKSVVIRRNGIRIGIIGVVWQATPSETFTRRLKFLPESPSVNEEAERLVSEDLVDTIIVLSHCGYDVEIEMAKNASSKIGLIVGGHTHTFLFTGKKPPGPDTPLGDYPTVITHSDGRHVLVVQASAFTKYLGNITVFYDSDGNVIRWDGAPIFLDSTFEKDPAIEEELQPWKKVVDSYGSQIVGSTFINLTGNCFFEECIIGNVVADAMAASYQGTNPILNKYPVLGLVPGLYIAATLPAGNISFAGVAEVLPFENTCDYAEIKGNYIWEFLNLAVLATQIQVSGLRLNYTLDPITLYSVEVNCTGCATPGFIPLNDEEYYLVAFPSYLSFSSKWIGFGVETKEYTKGKSDIRTLIDYLTVVSPITSAPGKRINFVTKPDHMATAETHSIHHSLVFTTFLIVFLYIVS